MSIFEPSPYANRMLAVFRIVAGVIFMSAGTMKVFGYPPGPTPMPFDPFSQVGIGGLLEVFGGLAIVLGAVTRPVAFILAGEMAVAYFQFHAPKGFFPTINGGIPAVLYCFFFLYLMLAGAGAFSIDSMIARYKSNRRARRLSGAADDHSQTPSYAGPR